MPLNLDLDEIRRLYVTERLSELEVARRLGVTRAAIRPRLERMGVVPRTVSEANYIRYERATPEEWERLRVHGRKVLARAPQTIGRRRKAAGTIHANQRLSKYERAVLDGLRERGVPAEGLWPLEGTNIDVAVPSVMLAVEIHGGWHGTRKKRIEDAKKAALCSANGWELLVFDRQRGSNKLRADPDLFCAHVTDRVAERYHTLAAAKRAGIDP